MNTKLNSSAICFYIFFLLYFITYIGENTNVKYLSILIFHIYFLFHCQKKQFNRLDKGLFVIICLISVSLIVSLFFNFNMGGAIKTFSLIDLYVIAFFLLSRNMANYKIDEIKMIYIITNTLFVVLLIAFFTGYNDTVSTYGRNSFVEARHQFGLGAASIVGFLCFIEFVLTYYLITIKQTRKNSIILLLKMFLSLYMTYLADIRSAMVSMIFFLLFYYFNKLPKNKRAKFLVLAALFVFFVLCIFFISGTTLDFNSLNRLFSARFTYYEKSIMEVIINNAVMFGTGSFRNSEVDVLGRVQIDNCFLDIFYQYGIICLTLFILMIIIICIKLYKINDKFCESPLSQTRYNQFINAFFSSVMIYSMVEKNLFSLSSALGLVTFILVFWYIEKYKYLTK